MTATFDTFIPASGSTGEFNLAEDKNLEIYTEMLDKLFAAAKPGVVFSAPVVSGNYTIITASEVASGGGFGYGKGVGPVVGPKITGETTPEGKPQPPTIGGGSGIGGGGGASGRPLAAIIIGPDGVKVQPIVDATKIAMTALTTFGVILATLMKIRRTVKKAAVLHK
jgi:uncharacterized spore protein YtfJ